MNIGDKIKRIRLEKGLSAEELGKRIGKNRATVYRYEAGDIERMPYDTLIDLSKALGVPIFDLLEMEFGPIETDERILPIIGAIACGTPILAEENIEGYFKIDDSVQGDFILKTKGDSMIDECISDGDYAFIKKQETAENGDIVAIMIGGEATLKKFYKDKDVVILQPANSNYKPIILTGGDVQILGVLTAVLSKR